MNIRWYGAVAAVAAAAALVGTAFAQTPQARHPTVVRTVKPVKTIPLRDMRNLNLPPALREIVGNRSFTQEQLDQFRERLISSGRLKPAGRPFTIPLKHLTPVSQPQGVQDPVVQTQAPVSASSTLTVGTTFPGIGRSNTPPDTIGCAPPDTNAAVGQNDVVEIVNLCDGDGVAYFEVWDKSGDVVQGVTPLAGLWSSGDCTNGNGDPEVLYDQDANRWVMEQFNSGYTGVCVAVSQTNDPTGAYYLYDFVIDAGGFTDYPKLGLWTTGNPNSDAYFVSTNDFLNSGDTYVNFTALQRSAMLTGSSAEMVVIDGTGYNEGGLDFSALPAGLVDGTKPPTDDPEIFMDYVSPYYYGGSTYALEMWQMTADWSNPSNSTLTGPTGIDVDPFQDADVTCVPQPSPGECLPTVGDRLMYPLVYRDGNANGTDQYLVTNHAVTVNGDGNPPVGIRWYELDAPAGSTSAGDWTIAQQGTYAPADGNSRWMGSIAMNGAGDLALGFTEASASLDPSVALTGQYVGADPGVMNAGETTLVAGTGVQESTGRWGDYSSMALDPANDCTFWTAQEYISETGSFNWSTDVGGYVINEKLGGGTNGGGGCNGGTISGTLYGSVIDSANGYGIPNAEIDIGNSTMYSCERYPVLYTPSYCWFILEDGPNPRPPGYYEWSYEYYLPPDSAVAVPYNVTALGYYPSSGTFFSLSDGRDNVNFYLTPCDNLNCFTLSGNILGYATIPLSGAEVTCLLGCTWGAPDTPGGVYMGTVWANPRTGRYSIILPKDATYLIKLVPYFSGFKPAAAIVTLNSDTTKNFLLKPDDTCTAPGFQLVNGQCVPIPGQMVTGQVSDGNVHRPLFGATVTDENGNSAQTVTHGPYTVYEMFEPSGDHTLTASKSGYQDGVQSVTVGSRGNKKASFTLGAGRLQAFPTSFAVNVPAGTTQTIHLYVKNTGTVPVDAQLSSIDAPPAAAPAMRPGSGGGRPNDVHCTGGISPLSLSHRNPSINCLGGGGGGNAPASGTSSGWTAIADLPNAAMDNCVADPPQPLTNDEVEDEQFLFDGIGSGLNVSNSVYLYDPATDTYTQLASNTVAREKPACADVGGMLYVVNGWDGSGNPVGTLEIYDPSSDSWTTGASNPVPQGGGSVAVALNGEIYVIGGCDASNCGSTAVEIYDPSTDSWSSAADYPHPVSWQACGAIAGKIYCAGGTAGTSEYADTYAYDPGTDTWTSLASIPVSSGGLWGSAYTATLDGKLVVQDGVTGNFTTVTNAGFSYDAGTDEWTSTGFALYPVYRMGSSCGFYQFGGSTGGFAPVTSAELWTEYDACDPVPWLSFDPASGSITPGQVVRVSVIINGAGQTSGTQSMVQIKVSGNTPYDATLIPLTVNWQ